MKKLFALLALVLVAGAAFGQASPAAGRFPGAVAGQGPGSTLNDDSCDIGVTPAATLLLPYFEVDFNSNANEAVNTVFTITNVSELPQIAHIVVWTDWSFPVLDFNIFLTGYDVQGISLYDIIARGQIPPTGSTTVPGPFSAENRPGPPRPPGVADASTINPALLPSAFADCASLPGPIPPTLLTQIQRGLTGLTYSFGGFGGCQVGAVHANAIGYVTIDTARTCSTSLPTDDVYWDTEIAFSNVLIGDYQRINPTVATGNYAGGEPLVHIRAIPEGDPVGIDPATDVFFPFTFYDRYVDERKEDRRQPLPGIWAARYIEEEAGVQDFATELAIWREGVQFPTCPSTGDPGVSGNQAFPYTEIVRFDEHENPRTLVITDCPVSPCVPGTLPGTNEASTHDTASSGIIPPDFTGTEDLGGWIYLNLNVPFTAGGASRLDAVYATTVRDETSNWVTVRMTAEGRYGVDFAAAWLGNGCSANPGVSEISATGSTFEIGPIDNNPFDSAINRTPTQPR